MHANFALLVRLSRHVLRIMLLVVFHGFLEHLVNAAVLQCFLRQRSDNSFANVTPKITYVQALLVLLEQRLTFIVVSSTP